MGKAKKYTFWILFRRKSELSLRLFLFLFAFIGGFAFKLVGGEEWSINDVSRSKEGSRKNRME